MARKDSSKVERKPLQPLVSTEFVNIMSIPKLEGSPDVILSTTEAQYAYGQNGFPDSITICEPHLDRKTIQGYPNKTLEEALSNADIVFIAMNHDLFSNVDGIYNFIKNGAWIVDIWNCLGRNEFLFQNTT